jgi:hypothetical protein
MLWPLKRAIKITPFSVLVTEYMLLITAYFFLGSMLMSITVKQMIRVICTLGAI